MSYYAQCAEHGGTHLYHRTCTFHPAPPGNAGRSVKNDSVHVFGTVGAQRIHLHALRSVGPSEQLRAGGGVAWFVPYRIVVVPRTSSSGAGFLMVPRISSGGAGYLMVPRISSSGADFLMVPRISSRGAGFLMVPWISSSGAGFLMAPRRSFTPPPLEMQGAR